MHHSPTLYKHTPLCSSLYKEGQVALTVMFSLYRDSNIAMAARDPDPMVANGRVSVEPWGYTWGERGHNASGV